MSYTFTDQGGHRQALIRALHAFRNEVRTDDAWPGEVNGLSTQLLLETAVDELGRCERLEPIAEAMAEAPMTKWSIHWIAEARRALGWPQREAFTESAHENAHGKPR